MMNSNYKNEIASAAKFLCDHSYDGELRTFIYEMMENENNLSHSDRWSMIYDWMQEHYPEVTGSLITGLVYYMEG